jgi:hypothetical protein
MPVDNLWLIYGMPYRQELHRGKLWQVVASLGKSGGEKA